MQYETNPILDKLPEHLRQYIKPQNYEEYSPIDQADGPLHIQPGTGSERALKNTPNTWLLPPVYPLAPIALVCIIIQEVP